jgi:hypothetical protein
LRQKRWLNFSDEDTNSTKSDESQCPTEHQNCLLCYNEFTDEIKNKICSFDVGLASFLLLFIYSSIYISINKIKINKNFYSFFFSVAEVSLTTDQTCGHLKIEKRIKLENSDDNEYLFSMASQCDCKNIFGKTVTLLTNWNEFDQTSNGFRFGPETIIVEGVSPVNDCNSLKRWVKKEAPEGLVKTTENYIPTPTLTPTPTPTPTPTEITNGGTETDVEKGGEKTIEEAKDRRTIQGDNFNTNRSSYLFYGSNEGKSQGNHNQQTGGHSGQSGSDQSGSGQSGLGQSGSGQSGLGQSGSGQSGLSQSGLGQSGESHFGSQQNQHSPQTNVSYLKPESMSQLY